MEQQEINERICIIFDDIVREMMKPVQKSDDSHLLYIKAKIEYLEKTIISNR